MNSHETKDQVRAGADIDELVIGGTRQGRPVLTHRALAALASGAALVCAAGLAATLAVDNGNVPDPASPTMSGGSVSGGRAASGAMTQKQRQILAVIQAKLPGELKVTAHHGIGTRSIVAIAIADSQGHTWVDARVGTTGEDGWDPCRAVQSCSVERVKKGTLYTLEELESGGNGTHYAATYTYERADGRYVSFGQSNVFNSDVRRSLLPLTDEQVRAILAAPEWDGLVADCQPEPGPNC
jgi:hypothetical protein